jgi:hypothetical protein
MGLKSVCIPLSGPQPSSDTSSRSISGVGARTISVHERAETTNARPGCEDSPSNADPLFKQHPQSCAFLLWHEGWRQHREDAEENLPGTIINLLSSTRIVSGVEAAEKCFCPSFPQQAAFDTSLAPGKSSGALLLRIYGVWRTSV